MAKYCAQHADQIEIDKKAVPAWDEAKKRLKRLRGVR